MDGISDGSQFSADSNSAIIKVVGVGGGGGNAVRYMYNQNIRHINYVVCNTDKQALDMIPVPNKLILGYEITKGLGAGNKPEVGRQCAEASEKEIRELFEDQTEMVFITAGMGGGTGTGAAPVVARIAKEMGVLTIGIVTVPFLFEGDKKILKAIDGANEMAKHVDALLVINNENLIDIYQDLTIFNAFDKADDTLANAARSISEIISEKCYINVDFQDVKTTLKDSGTAIISTAYGEGENRISDAFYNAFHSPLLKKHDIKTSKRLLFKFSCSKDSEHPIAAKEINEIRQFTAKLPSNLDVKWGIADDPSLGDKVKITVLASGFDVTLIESDEKKSGEIVFKVDNAETKSKSSA
ncbi:MAG: cell division protein FtsZ, partial [Muribaculaceae bacterium]|nr:cell division protein FtsZ [Muribaculaceae bacterium]